MNSLMNSEKKPQSWMIVLAFAALYLIWGSTYLGIKVAIETIPPFLMATSRFLLAGFVLYLVARMNGVGRPTLAQWKDAFVVGSFLIAGGNGVVTFAEQWIDSSMAALIIACNPFFMTLIGWWGGVQARPRVMAWLSLLGGFVGVAFLVSPSGSSSGGESFFGYGLVVMAVVFWTLGSVYSKRNPQTINPWLQSGMQMLCGGFVCFVLGSVMGEFDSLNIAGVSNRSWWAFGYLVVVGSLVGFTSYVFLLRNCAPSTVSSHAYVNPVVAVILGWLILGETLSAAGWVGSGLILASVFILLRQNKA